MIKEFSRWLHRKEKIDAIRARPGFAEREVWFAHLGVNIGSEQDGVGKDYLRPIVIVKKFNTDIFWAIPLTRTKKEHPYYFSFMSGAGESTAILSQIRLIDARRLSHKVAEIRGEDFVLLKQKITALLR